MPFAVSILAVGDGRIPAAGKMSVPGRPVGATASASVPESILAVGDGQIGQAPPSFVKLPHFPDTFGAESAQTGHFTLQSAADGIDYARPPFLAFRLVRDVASNAEIQHKHLRVRVRRHAALRFDDGRFYLADGHPDGI